MLQAVGGFGGQDGVQHLVARLVPALIRPDVPLDLVQAVQLLLRPQVRPEHRDLVLQVVVFPINHVDGLLASLVAGVLQVQHVLQGVHLPQGVELAQLEVVGV